MLQFDGNVFSTEDCWAAAAEALKEVEVADKVHESDEVWVKKAGVSLRVNAAILVSSSVNTKVEALREVKLADQVLAKTCTRSEHTDVVLFEKRVS